MRLSVLQKDPHYLHAPSTACESRRSRGIFETASNDKYGQLAELAEKRAQSHDELEVDLLC